MDYVVYILASEKTDKLYKGYTSNLIARFCSHNELGTKGWTKGYRPWWVVYVSFYETKKEAMEFESFLKTGKGREWIKRNVVIG